MPGTPGVGVKRQGVESPVSFLDPTVPPACKSSVVTNTLSVQGPGVSPRVVSRLQLGEQGEHGGGGVGGVGSGAVLGGLLSGSGHGRGVP